MTRWEHEKSSVSAVALFLDLSAGYMGVFSVWKFMEKSTLCEHFYMYVMV